MHVTAPANAQLSMRELTAKYAQFAAHAGFIG